MKKIHHILLVLCLCLGSLLAANIDGDQVYSLSFINAPIRGYSWTDEYYEVVRQDNSRTLDILAEYYNQPGYTQTARQYFKKYDDGQTLSEIENMSLQLTEGLRSETEKAKAIHDWISQNIFSSDDETYDGEISHRCANPIQVWKNREGVCYGVANLTDLMMQYAGIKCVVVRGGTVYGPTHVWNAAMIDGYWYYLDNTWDANYYEMHGRLSYTYFLKDAIPL